MKPFQMQPKMSTIGGTFYPTGYAFIMFPQDEDLEQIAKKLEQSGVAAEHIMSVSPDVIIREIGRVNASSEVPLPSVGTEGHTLNRYVQLAREGQHALMIRAPSDDECEKVMRVVRETSFSYGQKYHMLAIEDLE